MKPEMLFFLIGVLAILVMGVLLAFALLYPNGSLQGGAGGRHILISASGTAYASPQAATLYARMNGSGESPEIATSALATTLNEFNFTVSKYIGGNLSRITTQSYSLQKVHNTTEYQATAIVALSIPNIGNVSPILGSLPFVSNVYIDGVAAKLSMSQESALSKEAISSALENATAQAQVIAGNGTLSIVNVSVYSSRPYLYAPFALAPAAIKQNPTYFNGMQGVQETVSVVFTYS